MDLRDLFVAAVALVLGGMMLYTAIVGQGWCFQMKIARIIEETRGRQQARTFIGSIGTLVMLLGLYLLLAPIIASSIFQSTDFESPTDRRPNGTMSFAKAD